MFESQATCWILSSVLYIFGNIRIDDCRMDVDGVYNVFDRYVILGT